MPRRKINKALKENELEEYTKSQLSFVDVFLKFLILTLSISALVLGYKVYKLYYGENDPIGEFLKFDLPQKTPTPSMSTPPKSDRNNTILYDTDESLLLFPSADAPQEVKQSHYDAVIKKAILADEISILDCKPDPFVTKVKNSNPVNIKNVGVAKIQLRLDEKQVYDIDPGKTKSITFDFTFGQGTYGYVCNDIPGPVGIFLVVE